MGKSEWGIKRVCFSCAAKFYDLKKTPITCPSCNAVIEIASATKSRRSKAKEIVIEAELLDGDSHVENEE